MSEYKVSIVTPCYNGEEYLDGYFESILAQTYRPLELIFVNDGSTDGTEQIALSYSDKLKESGIEYRYLFQPNGGQAKAVNTALPHVTGEFLVWPDSDDLLSPDSIEKKVLFLLENKEYSFVRSNGRKFDYNTHRDLGRISWPGDPLQEDIFLDLINEKTYCTPGCYMLKMSALRDIYPDLSIYVSTEGQNWQILIPMAGKYKCGYIDEDLFFYAIRQNSHSHRQKSEEETVARYLELKKILEIGVEKSGRTDRDYQYLLDTKYEKILLSIYANYDNCEKATELYKILKSKRALDDSDITRYLKKFHPNQYQLYEAKKLVGRSYKKLKRILHGNQ